MKTVIFVWTQQVCNRKSTETEHFWGLGDILRGIIHVYQLCEKYGYDYIVDIQHHPISKYISYKRHKYSDLILSKKNEIPFIEDIENYILSTPYDILFFQTNSHFTEPITDGCKHFIKALLTPTDEFAELIQYARMKIPFPSYTILHYRLGDKGIIMGENGELSQHIQHIKQQATDTCILLSDSQEFKGIVKSHCQIFMFDIDIGHIGYALHEQKIKDTLIEFFICQNARLIKTHSVYSWMSGFMKCVHDLYDVPIIQI
jgi:hypothetical protein